MQDVITAIIERIEFEKKDLFADHLASALKPAMISEGEIRSEHPSIVFNLDAFLKGFSPFINEFGKEKKYVSGSHALSIICDELGIEVDENECFLLFHLKNFGKFRVKETKFHQEIKGLWGQYKEYALEDREFSYALKNLMRKKLINYRKGNLQLNPTLTLHYR